MGKLRIDTLDASSPALLESCTTLIVNAFADPVRYSAERVGHELRSNDKVFYRQFFIAVQDGEIRAVGGAKAADWAAKTHLLYLSAVAPESRGQGIGRALIKARIEWLEKNFPSGRIIVSTSHCKRFRSLGFVDIRKGTVDGRHLMLRRF
ncbi:GNAT family N-acetyltransferase [Dechloromonas denitrificans]|uniref:GNAT family N-acetyltransferase n=1 Tax=Dechloromonas denitrificans TaxID=281362 RepID=UPI001CFB11A5|nr:GNAT family N-acetyltransferase [Dechloromonas denitrificans]UCV07471.1 GNAT family N-acetyltransferase [Dechloromonas denitrificans]